MNPKITTTLTALGKPVEWVGQDRTDKRWPNVSDSTAAADVRFPSGAVAAVPLGSIMIEVTS